LPIGPGFQGGTHYPPERPREPEHDVGRCKRCGKEAELDEGLCTECKWEIQVGMVKPPAEEEKKHFWSHTK